MSNGVNINGRTVDPNSIRKIQIPEGKNAAAYVKENENLIRNNFKDEIYFEVNGELFVSEDKFVVENLGLKGPQDAKIKMGSANAVALLIDDESETHKVTKLDIKGATTHQKWLEKELDVEKGDKVSLHDLQKQADALFKTNKFLSVNFTPKAGKEGIELSLDVVEVPTQIKVNGAPAGEHAEIQKLFTQPLTRENITKGMESLQKYHDNKQALVAGLDFTVENGALNLQISRVQLPENLTFVGINMTDAKAVDGFFQKPFNYENIQKGMEQTRRHFEKQGLILPQFDFTVDGTELQVMMKKAPMPTSMKLTGMTVYKEADVKALFKEPLTMEHIQDGLKELQKKYADDGYVLLPPEGVSADLNKGVLTVVVKEAHLSDIEITGNDKTKSNVITRELRAKADQPLNIKTLDDDLKRVAGTGLFGSVNKTVEPDPENPGKVKLKVHVSEEKASAFNIGAAYGMSTGFSGTSSLTFGNLGGTNQKLTLDGTLGQKVWGGGVSYFNPRVGDSVYSLGASIYHRQWSGPYSGESRTGSKVTVGRPLGDYHTSPWRVDLSVNGERIGIDPKYSASGTGVDYRVAIQPSITYNTLDNPVMPHKGTKLHAYVEPSLGSANTFKMGTENNHYIPLGERFTLSMGAQGGTILGDAPLYDKFNNAAPGRTIYGWESDGKLVGSNYAIGSLGVNAQIWGPVSATAKLTGGDFWDGKDVSPKVGAGIGVNVKVGNFGVLNAGYGFKLYGKEKDDAPGAFHIGFGVPF